MKNPFSFLKSKDSGIKAKNPEFGIFSVCFNYLR